MKRPFFSIITCVYNSEQFLGRNITSVREQSFTNYEHIIVYSPSKDKSSRIIKKYMQESRFVKITTMKPMGIAPAFNKGILLSSGKYLMFLNSDDYFFDKDVLNDIYKFLLRRKDIDWIYGVINVVEKDGRKVGIFPRFSLFKGASAVLLKYINYIPHQSVFIKRDIFGRFGLYDEDLTSQMDYEYWLRISDKTRWEFIERIVSNYTIREGAKSSSKKNFEENRLNMRLVQKRYTNKMELFLSGIIDRAVQVYNKTLR